MDGSLHRLCKCTSHLQNCELTISQADYIILTADSNDKSNVTAMERKVIRSRTTAQKKLVLIHNSDEVSPLDLTNKWLKVKLEVHIAFSTLSLT
jgi:hypothetical protein